MVFEIVSTAERARTAISALSEVRGGARAQTRDIFSAMVSFELVTVTAVRVAGPMTLELRFSHGISGSVDLASRLNGPMLEPLRDPSMFARVRVAHGTVEWPNGADFDPEALFEMALKGSGMQPEDDGPFVLEPHAAGMPEISRFFEIVIRMFFVDHAHPHFHAYYGESSIAVETDGDGIRGSFPPHRLTLVFEWRDAYRDELRENWERLRRGEAPLEISPLD